MKYAQLEVKLGEIDRARGIFSHGSQMSDPRTAKSYWKAWQEFEVRHGNEDTFREMLRIKRSVQAQSTHRWVCLVCTACGKTPPPNFYSPGHNTTQHVHTVNSKIGINPSLFLHTYMGAVSFPHSTHCIVL